MGRIIGVDLGTTNTVGAILDKIQPRVLETHENRPLMRSVVGLKRRKAKGGDGPAEVLVGDVAFDNWPMAPADTVLSIKRLMGRAVADSEVQRVRQRCLYKIVEPSDGTKDSVRVVMGGREYSPIEISAMLLRKVKEDAEFRLGEPVTHAVITVPAYFSQRQKDATRKAGLLAGLTVIKILDEPTAAAVAFGMESADSTDPKYILVYDLGGGTFDISVLMWAGNVFAPLNLEGDMWLGGDDFDQVLVDTAVEHVRKEHQLDPIGDLRFMAALKKAARDTKERLSSARSADLMVPGMLHDADDDLVDVELEITREQFERMIRPLVDRTISLTEKALKNANLSADQIDHVIMAGNATCIPLVQEAMEKMFGKDKVLRKVHPKHSVALGAAIVATRIGERVVCEAPDPSDATRQCGHVNRPDATACAKCGAPLVLTEDERRAAASGEPEPVRLEIGGIAPFPYGVQTAGDEFNIFIEKGEPYPTEDPRTQPFYTRAPNQRLIAIPVYGGDHREKASLNEKQGEVFAILPPGLPAGTPIRVKVWLDPDGVFALSAHLEDGTDLQPWILEGEQDQKAVEAIEKVEAALAEKAANLGPADMAAVEQARHEAFNELKRRDFDAALDRVRRFDEAVADAGGADKDALRTRAENLIGYTQFVLQQYGWAFEAERVYQLNRLVEEVRQAMDAGGHALETKVNELDRATDSIPDVVRLLLGLRGAIQNRIRPVDPVTAHNLLGELDEVEKALRARTPTASADLMKFLAKVTQAVAAAEAKTPKTGPKKCPLCGAEAGGRRFCPNNHDQWLLDQKASGATSGIISK